MLKDLSTQQTLIRLIIYSKNYLFILFIVLLLEIIASFFSDFEHNTASRIHI